MNIFYLDHNPQRCAEMHCDKHVVKMPTECAQLYHDPGNTVIETNRAYYIGDKGRFCRWKGRNAPDWFFRRAA